MTLRWMSALLLSAALPSLAMAQDATQNQAGDQGGVIVDPPPEPADPVESLIGLWRIDEVEPWALRESLMGNLLRIDRQAIASLSGGTCSSPSFKPDPDPTAPDQVRVDVICLGQPLAWASWSAADPNSVAWTEPDMGVVLHRVTSAAASEPATSGSSGSDDAGGGDDSGSQGSGDESGGSE